MEPVFISVDMMRNTLDAAVRPFPSPRCPITSGPFVSLLATSSRPLRQLTYQSVVFCYEEWPVIATNHYTFSIDPVTNMLIPSARSSTGNDIWSNSQSISNFIFQDLGYLARDVLGTIRLAYTSSGNSGPVAYGISLQTPSICPVAWVGNSTVKWV